MMDIKEIVNRYPTVRDYEVDRSGAKELLKNAEKLFRDVTLSLSDEISGIRANSVYSAALSAAFEVISNSLMQPYQDREHITIIKNVLLSSAVSVSIITKDKKDD